MTIEIGESEQLNATDGLVSYSWMPTEGLSCTNCPDPIASPTQTTLYSVLVTDINGCGNTDSVLVSVRTLCEIDIKIPNAFTPNQDGLNDFFRVASLSNNLAGIEIYVYDRWEKKYLWGKIILDGMALLKGKNYPMTCMFI